MTHQVIFVPKMLYPLTIEDLAEKRMCKLKDANPRFILKHGSPINLTYPHHWFLTF